ncbi:hypothetical protein ACIF8T_26170 [Streptomyces sp. NPDC085946]
MVVLALLVPWVLLGMMFALDAFEGFLFPPAASVPSTPAEDHGVSPDSGE